MNETRDERSGRPATERAEEVLDSVGERIGRFLSLAMQRVEGMTGGDRPNEGAPGEAPSGAATERAEQLLDGMGESVGRFAAMAGWRIRKAAALAREEAEDIWAEAQQVRSGGRNVD
jgi:hypothetical protein